jgi:predicted AlkP superfamily pyrophosphatase or phosphodiesterase
MMHKISDSIQKHDDGDFLYPCYKENCISNIPGSILDLFGINHNLRRLPFLGKEVYDAQKVVLLILDGFGYNQFLRHKQDNKFLADFSKKSDVFTLTSIFPSQTTNALTTLNTGLTPQEHGLFEYYLYMKEVGRIVNTLRFEPIGSVNQNLLAKEGLDPKIMFKGITIQSMLEEAGIKSFTHIYAPYAYSASGSLLFEGSTMVPTLKSSDLFVSLRKKLEQEPGPSYHFVHLSNLDTIAHEYGPSSYEYSAELSVISYMINKELIQKIDSRAAKETLLLMTSDHGGVNIVPENITYLNGFPELLKNLQNGASGERILPTGSARDVFLHVQQDKMEKTKQLLASRVGDKAKIVETKEAINDGLFGLGEINPKFLERAGNLLLLPYRNETVWFDHFIDYKYKPVGQHGGLNQDEMLVPLSVSTLDKLK